MDKQYQTDKRFVEQIGDHIIELSVRERLNGMEYRFKKMEHIINHSSPSNTSTSHYLCNGDHPRYVHSSGSTSRLVHREKQALYCDKCDKLYCKREYCDHLKKFIKNAKNAKNMKCEK